MSIKIKNHKWKIFFVSPNSNFLRKSDGSFSVGVTDNNLKSIFISNNINNKLLENVICHELTHCICFEYNIYLPMELEERLCNFMEEHGREIIFLLDEILYPYSLAI